MANGQQMSPQQQNAMARQMLLQTSLPIRKKVGTFTGFGLGETARIRLLNVGLTTNVQLKITYNLTTTLAPVQSGFGGAVIANQVVLTDYNQIERVNTDGYSLKALRGFKRRRLDGLTSAAYPQYPDLANTTEFETFQTGNVTDQTNSVFIDVPFAVDAEMGNLTGISLSQAVVGEQFVTVKFADDLLGDDPLLYPYQSSGTSTAALVGTITVEVWQEYLQPQNVQFIPMIDASTIYEVRGLYKSSSDISTAGEKLINYPNVRTVFSSFHVAIDDDAQMGTTQINSIELLANSSQILSQDSYASKRRFMYGELGGNIGDGTILMNHRSFPISTAIYGNVQMQLKFGTITGGNTYIQSQFESIYASGTPLPGISTQ